MCDMFEEAYLSQQMSTNELDSLKTVEIVLKMKTGQAGPQ